MVNADPGQSTILTAVRTGEPIDIDGHASEVSWANATELIIVVQDGSIGKVDVRLRALYDEEYLYILARWKDTTESIFKEHWVFNDTNKNWNSSQDEDRFAIFWNINDSIAGFNIGGCAMLCHGDRIHTNSPGEKGDSWHWGAARTNPVGYCDDKFINSTVIFDEEEGKWVARYGDFKTSGGYRRNVNPEKNAPLYYEPHPKDVTDAMFIFQSEIDNGEALEITNESVFREGGWVPGYILERPMGSRGDIDARGVWNDGIWTLELKRKLKTSNDDDVQFDITKTYRFGVAVMDNTGGFKSFGQGHSFDLGARTLEFGGLGSEEVTQLALISDYLRTAKGYIENREYGLAISEINNALSLYNEIADTVANEDPALYMKIKEGFGDSKRNPSAENIDALIYEVDEAILTLQGKREPTEVSWNLKLLVIWGQAQIYVFILLALLALFPISKTIQIGRKSELRSMSVFLVIMLIPIILEGLGRIGILSRIHFLQNFSFMTNEYATLLWAGLMVLAMYVGRAGFGEVTNTIRSLRLYSDKLEKEISERKKAERMVIQSEKLAATGKLAASLAHEINNPLTGIKNCIYILMEDHKKKDKKRRYLDMAEEELDRIAKMVQQLLDFYRPSRDTLAPTDMNAVLDDVLVLVESQLIKKRIELLKELHPNLPKTLASSEQLKQVFLNIILNAIEAMPDGGKLFIKTRVQDRNIEVEFTDTGVGIPEENLRHLFDPFFSTKKRGKGTGLGLSVSYGIVQAHNGRIEVKSNIGEGSTFIIILPIE